MKIIIKRGIIIFTALGLFAAVGLSFIKGAIPTFADTEDVSYAKLCGYQPSSGQVWTWGTGFGSGIAFFRLHLSKDSYPATELLTEKNMPKYEVAPWWWGARPNGRITIRKSGGLGHGTESYEIYDPDKGLLFVSCEWD